MPASQRRNIHGNQANRSRHLNCDVIYYVKSQNISMTDDNNRNMEKENKKKKKDALVRNFSMLSVLCFATIFLHLPC